ncbi:hypothetical protein K438DRAFT_1786466 [Mycena galopus ATCC 62051]|nr:hypothetical protein K438DRAFT_1786466 [Mycena galopus ATCC 62051]
MFSLNKISILVAVLFAAAKVNAQDFAAFTGTVCDGIARIAPARISLSEEKAMGPASTSKPAHQSSPSDVSTFKMLNYSVPLKSFFWSIINGMVRSPHMPHFEAYEVVGLGNPVQIHFCGNTWGQSHPTENPGGIHV